METTSIKTERDALREIVSWSLGRPKWQRDALRRLVVSGELSSDDITELTALCKESAKQNEPLETEHFGAQTLGAPTVALRNIRDIQNVNALAEGQTLNFIPKGVTIVYGDNGAGKSGYVRILKQACRARIVRGKGEEILDNIYVASSGPQVAEIEYDAGAQSQKSQWKNGEKPDDLLSEISVFDSRTANVHVEETNDLAYTPYPMKLLERLVNACKAVKENLDAEISTLKLQTPESIKSPKCSPDTKAGKLVNKLGKNTDPQTVHDLSTLSVDEGRRLAELAADFAQDPKATARRLRAEKVRLENIKADIIALHDAISDEDADEFARLAADLTTKEAAALLASQNLSKDEPLEGVGSEVWRSLWEAARAYSTDIAYPDKDYPVTATTRAAFSVSRNSTPAQQRACAGSRTSFKTGPNRTPVERAKHFQTTVRRCASPTFRTRLLGRPLFLSATNSAITPCPKRYGSMLSLPGYGTEQCCVRMAMSQTPCRLLSRKASRPPLLILKRGLPRCWLTITVTSAKR
jgi:hypothetical protein